MPIGAVTIRLAKIAESFTFPEFESLPEASQHYVVAMGLTQSVNDTVAGVKRADFETDDEFRAACLAKYNVRLAQIIDGNVPGTRAPADPRLASYRKAADILGEMTADDIAAVQLAREAAKANA